MLKWTVVVMLIGELARQMNDNFDDGKFHHLWQVAFHLAMSAAWVGLLIVIWE